jgi:hypothetical protein
MPDPTVFPTVHLNGTGRKTLSEGYQSAYSKLIEFRNAFRSIEFNARDYYVQSNTAFAEAQTERDIMEHKIGALMQYLEAHLIHLGE